MRADVQLERSVVEEISKDEKEKGGPRYPCEERRKYATWLLDPELVGKIQNLSRELNVAQYRLVEKLLEFGLSQYENGELLLRVKPVIERYTLE